MLSSTLIRPRQSSRAYVGAILSGLLLLILNSSANAADPTPPGELRYEVYSETSAEVFWNRATDDGLVVAYEIKVNDDIIGNRDALSYYSNTLVSGQLYNVEVTSIDNDGNRSVPASVSFVAGETGTSASGSFVAAPAGLQASVYSSTSGEIMWDRPTTFGLNYQVSRNGSVVTTTTGISYYDNNLTPATAYTYQVVAIDGDGNRSSASEVSLTTTGGPVDGTPPDPLAAVLARFASIPDTVYNGEDAATAISLWTCAELGNADVTSRFNVQFFLNTRGQLTGSSGAFFDDVEFNYFIASDSLQLQIADYPFRTGFYHTRFTSDNNFTAVVQNNATLQRVVCSKFDLSGNSLGEGIPDNVADPLPTVPTRPYANGTDSSTLDSVWVCHDDVPNVPAFGLMLLEDGTGQFLNFGSTDTLSWYQNDAGDLVVTVEPDIIGILFDGTRFSNDGAFQADLVNFGGEGDIPYACVKEELNASRTDL